MALCHKSLAGISVIGANNGASLILLMLRSVAQFSALNSEAAVWWSLQTQGESHLPFI